MCTHLSLGAIPSSWVRPLNKSLGEAAAPGFSQRILVRIYVSAQVPSHLAAFGKDGIGASPGHGGIAAKVGDEQRELTDRRAPLSWENLPLALHCHLRQSQEKKENWMY